MYISCVFHVFWIFIVILSLCLSNLTLMLRGKAYKTINCEESHNSEKLELWSVNFKDCLVKFFEYTSNSSFFIYILQFRFVTILSLFNSIQSFFYSMLSKFGFLLIASMTFKSHKLSTETFTLLGLFLVILLNSWLLNKLFWAALRTKAKIFK